MKLLERHPTLATTLQVMLFVSLIVFLVTVPRPHNAQVQAFDVAPLNDRTITTLPPFAPNETLLFTNNSTLSVFKQPSPGSGLDEQGGPPSGPRSLFETGPADSGSPLPSGDSTPGHDTKVHVERVMISPHGKYAIFHVADGPILRPWILDRSIPETPTYAPLTGAGKGVVLGWHPTGEQVLMKVSPLDVQDPGLWLVQVADGSHRFVPLPELVAPEGLLDAEFSPDGDEILYAITKGIGFGSEVWRTDPQGKSHERLLTFDEGVVANLQYAPNGQAIAFSTLADSPVPFAEAPLWVMSRDARQLRAIATMDGGRGQEPIWTHDSQNLLYVARENYDNESADFMAEALVSSIRSVNVITGKSTILVPADGARQLDVTLADDGTIFFVSNRSGVLEVWTVSPDLTLTQITHDGVDKRYPARLP